jgi:hypothetical protein
MGTLPKKSPKKKKRTHLPALPPERLELTLRRLQELKVDDLIKKQVGDILKAASNPDHGKIDVVVKSLPKKRREMIGKTAREVQKVTKSITARGMAALDEMSDEEWERLLDE